ncbi:MAG: hypothetical protein WDW38_005502 [Sanguina aurantia]
MPTSLNSHTPAGSVDGGHVVTEKAAAVAFGKAVAGKLPKTYPGSPLLKGSLESDPLDVADPNWKDLMRSLGSLAVAPRATAVPTHKGPELGVSLRFLMTFAQAVPLSSSTTHIVEAYVLPATREAQCRFTDTLSRSHLGLPTFYISHSWHAKFYPLVYSILRLLWRECSHLDHELGLSGRSASQLHTVTCEALLLSAPAAHHTPVARVVGTGMGAAAPPAISRTPPTALTSSKAAQTPAPPSNPGAHTITPITRGGNSESARQARLAEDMAAARAAVSAAAQGTLLCLDSSATALSRVWCLFEVGFTQSRNALDERWPVDQGNTKHHHQQRIHQHRVPLQHQRLAGERERRAVDQRHADHPAATGLAQQARRADQPDRAEYQCKHRRRYLAHAEIQHEGIQHADQRQQQRDQSAHASRCICTKLARLATVAKCRRDSFTFDSIRMPNCFCSTSASSSASTESSPRPSPNSGCCAGISSTVR